MESRRSGLYISLLVILGVITLGGSLWMSHQISAKDTGGGRFWIEWIGVRARLVDGYSPYNPIVTTEIHDQVSTLFNWAPGPKPSYNSPLFSAIISLPFALIPDAGWAHTAWFAAQFWVMLLTVLAGTRLVGWKPTWWLFMLISFFILLSLRNSMSWYEGSMMIWVSGLMVWTLHALKGKR